MSNERLSDNYISELEKLCIEWHRGSAKIYGDLSVAYGNCEAAVVGAKTGELMQTIRVLLGHAVPIVPVVSVLRFILHKKNMGNHLAEWKELMFSDVDLNDVPKCIVQYSMYSNILDYFICEKIDSTQFMAVFNRHNRLMGLLNDYFDRHYLTGFDLLQRQVALPSVENDFRRWKQQQSSLCPVECLFPVADKKE